MYIFKLKVNNMELSVYIFHPDGEQAKKIQKFAALVFFNADYRASVYAGTDDTKILDLITRHSSGMDILILPVSPRGYELGKALRERNRSTALIYVFGGMEEVLDAFQSLPIAYITGQSDEQTFSAALLRAALWARRGKNKFYHESRTDLIQCSYSDIDYFESNYRVVNIHLKDSTVKTVTAKLDDIQTILPGELFCRCHQSYIVNLSHIERVDKSAKTIHFLSGAFTYASRALFADLLTALSGGVKNEMV